jgi:triosephosphate isomerase
MNRRYRKTVIAGNWKMNMTASETKQFAEELKKPHAPRQVVRHHHLRPLLQHSPPS